MDVINSKGLKIKMFIKENIKDIEEEINQWLEGKNLEIYDIKLNVEYFNKNNIRGSFELGSVVEVIIFYKNKCIRKKIRRQR